MTYKSKTEAVAAALATGHDKAECGFRRTDAGWTFEVLPEYLTDADVARMALVEAGEFLPPGSPDTEAESVAASAPNASAPVYDLPAPLYDHPVPLPASAVVLVIEGTFTAAQAAAFATRLGASISLRDSATGATLQTVQPGVVAASAPRGPSGRDIMLTLLQRPQGASKADLMSAGGWHVQPDMKAFGKSKKCSVSKEWTPSGFIYRAVYGIGIGQLVQHDPAHRCTPDAAPANDADRLAEAAD